MDKLELWYLAKPYVLKQAWGIYNPAYLKFGFDHHNGVDFALESDRRIHSPCPIRIVDIGYNDGAGNYIRFITTKQYMVLGDICYVGGMIMHMESQAVKVGDILKVGDFLGIGDNTGFSTGPHTHLSTYRLIADISNGNVPLTNRLDKDPSTDYTFDPALLFNGFYAVDSGTVLSLLQGIILLLKKAIGT